MLDDFPGNIGRDNFYVGRAFGSAFDAVMNEEKDGKHGRRREEECSKTSMTRSRSIKKAAERNTGRIGCAR